MAELAGMSFNCIREERKARIAVENYDDPITRGLPRATEFGDFDRPLTSGFEMNTQTMAPITLPPMTVNPMFYVDDPQATVLGTFKDSGKPAFAVRRFADWTSVYIGSLAPSSLILRAIANAARAHLYEQTDQIIYANQSFVAIHTNGSGERVLKLPRRSDVYEVFDDRVLGRNVDTLKMDLPAFATRLLFLGDTEQFKLRLDRR